MDNKSTNQIYTVGGTIDGIAIDASCHSVAICGGINKCPHKEEIEKGARIKMKNEMFTQHKQPQFGGAYYSLDKEGKEIFIYIKKVIYNNPATIVFWSDGTKTISKCDVRDKYDPEKGLILCTMKKMYGGEMVHNLLEDWCSIYSYATITLSDVRKKHKD